MRDYAKVSPRFWTGETGRFLREAGADVQRLAFYLLTCPSSNAIGLYYCPMATIAHELGAPIERVRRAFETLSQGLPKASATPSQGVGLPLSKGSETPSQGVGTTLSKGAENPSQGVSMGSQTPSQGGFAYYDEGSDTVWVPEMARFQIAESLRPRDNRIAAVRRELSQVVNSKYVMAFYEKYGVAFSLPDTPS